MQRNSGNNNSKRRASTKILSIHRHHDRKGINLGEKNGQWKGDTVSIESLHDWVKYWKVTPILCKICKKVPPRDLANISQEYKRDLNDYQYLCRACHMKSDHRMYSRDKKGRFYRKEEVVIAAVPALTR